MSSVLVMFCVATAAFGGDIHHAAREGDMARLTADLARGVDVEARQDEGTLFERDDYDEVNWMANATPLMVAVRADQYEAAELLIEHGADVNADYYPDDPEMRGGGAVILLAAEHASARLLELVVEAGADVETRNFEDWSALFFAARSGSFKKVKYLLDQGLEPNEHGWTGTTPLMLAARGGNPKVIDLLIEHDAEVNVQDETGDTALMYAAKFGHVDAIRRLLTHGIDLKATDDDERSALYEAVNIFGSPEIIRLLAQQGLDVNAVDENGESLIGHAAVVTCLMGAFELDSDEKDKYIPREKIHRTLFDLGADPQGAETDKAPPFVAIAQSGLLSCIKLFVEKGIDPTMRWQDATALHWAAPSNSVEALKYFIDAGVDPNETGRLGLPLTLAAAHGASDAVIYLIPFTNKIDTPWPDLSLAEQLDSFAAIIVARIYGGWTALHGAALRCSTDAVQALLDAGADPTLKTDDGETPVDLARQRLDDAWGEDDIEKAKAEAREIIELLERAHDK